MSVPQEQTEVARANDALRLIGEPPITSLADRRHAARLCKGAFATVRDRLLRAAPWQFAKATAAPPVAPFEQADPLWKLRYVMPSDCLAIREVRDAGVDSWEMRSAGVDGDIRVFLHTDMTAPIVVYTRRVVNPASWDELFADAFAHSLAATINPALGRDKGLTDQLAQAASLKLLQAQQREARERAPQVISRETSWTRVRRGGARY